MSIFSYAEVLYVSWYRLPANTNIDKTEEADKPS